MDLLGLSKIRVHPVVLRIGGAETCGCPGHRLSVFDTLAWHNNDGEIDPKLLCLQVRSGMFTSHDSAHGFSTGVGQRRECTRRPHP